MAQANKGKKILFIEENVERRERIGATFARSGMDTRIEFVSTPEAAFEVMKREAVDAVFVNQAETGIEAFEFLRRLALLSREAPVIIMSPQADEDSVLRALRDGAADCVPADGGAYLAYPSVARREIARFEAVHESLERDRAILRSHRQWMSIIDAGAEALFVLDSAHTIVKVNKVFADMIGKHPRDIVGKQLMEVFGKDLAAAAERSGELGIGDEVYRVSSEPLREDDTTLTMHVLKNISEVRRLKEQLYRSEKQTLIGRIVPGVVHELNNGLTGVMAFTDLLMGRAADDARPELKKIADSAERCKKILDNLQAFSRQRAPSKSIESINDIVERAIELRAYWHKRNNIRVVREFDAESTIHADAQLVQQAVLHLLLNAEEAIAEAGRTQGLVRIITRRNEDERRITITMMDNGRGVPQDAAARIFDPFFTTRPPGAGAGLGLSLARSIIAEQGGALRLDRADGEGAVFTIELPTS